MWELWLAAILAVAGGGWALRRLLQSVRPAEPEAAGGDEDPFAPVGAPRKPRPPMRAAAVALEEPDQES